MRFFLTFFFTFSLTYFFSQDSLKITYYNLLNFPSSQQDRVDTLKKILDFIQPDIFVINELTSFNGGALIKNNVLNSGSSNDFQSALYFDGPDTDNLLFYDKNKFEDDYKIENYGVNFIEQDNKLIVNKLDWKGKAKKSGLQMGDIISNFKIENPNRPNKGIVYPFALALLLLFGYFNYRRNISYFS